MKLRDKVGEIVSTWQGSGQHPDELTDQIMKAVGEIVPEKGNIQRYPKGSTGHELQLLSDGFDVAIDEINKELE